MGQVRHRYLKTFSLLFVLMTLFGCATTPPGQLEEQRLHALLGDLKDQLVRSDQVVQKSLRQLRRAYPFGVEEYQRFSEIVTMAFQGEVIYEYVVQYFKTKVSPKVINRSFEVFQAPDVTALAEKEATDLNPENFQEYEKVRPSGKALEKRMRALKKIDKGLKLSDGSLKIVKSLGDAINRAFFAFHPDKKIRKQLDQMMENALHNLKLQIDYFNLRSLEYTYQNLTESELETLKDKFTKGALSKFYSEMFKGVEYGYQQALEQAVGEIKKIRSKTTAAQL